MTALVAGQQLRQAFGDRGESEEQDAMTRAIVDGWNLMGGALDWSAAGPVAELLAVDDVETWLRGLAHLRDLQRGAKC